MSLTYEELSEEYRMSMKGLAHKVPQDLYTQMRSLIKHDSEALDKAKLEKASDTIIDGLKEKSRSDKQLVELVIEARIRYVQKMTAITVRDWEVTPEERTLLDSLERVKAQFRHDVEVKEI